jgi:hypothetical protein
LHQQQQQQKLAVCSVLSDVVLHCSRFCGAQSTSWHLQQHQQAVCPVAVVYGVPTAVSSPAATGTPAIQRLSDKCWSVSSLQCCGPSRVLTSGPSPPGRVLKNTYFVCVCCAWGLIGEHLGPQTPESAHTCNDTHLWHMYQLERQVQPDQQVGLLVVKMVKGFRHASTMLSQCCMGLDCCACPAVTYGCRHPCQRLADVTFSASTRKRPVR